MGYHMRHNDWKRIAKEHGYPTIKALIIHQYLLMGRRTSHVAELLGCHTTTVLNLIKAMGLRPRGLKSTILTAHDRQKWELALKMEGYTPHPLYDTSLDAAFSRTMKPATYRPGDGPPRQFNRGRYKSLFDKETPRPGVNGGALRTGEDESLV